MTFCRLSAVFLERNNLLLYIEVPSESMNLFFQKTNGKLLAYLPSHPLLTTTSNGSCDGRFDKEHAVNDYHLATCKKNSFVKTSHRE